MHLLEYIREHNDCIESLEQVSIEEQWSTARDMMLQTLTQKGKLLIAGNGGSAADAQHFAAEMVGRFLKERKAYAAIALTTDSSVLTSVGNDYDFDQIFSRQIEALGHAEDCFIAISTSGNSSNIVNALKTAKDLGLKTILLSGNDGGLAADLADISIIVQSDITSHIQEAHLILYHAWCRSIEETLYGKE